MGAIIINVLPNQLGLETRRGTQIVNYIDRILPTYGDSLRIADYREQYPHETHRPDEASRKYNCHGLTFASRRTRILDPAEIAKILREDEYSEVAFTDVLPGDIVVYYKDGDLEHSGIVVSVDNFHVPTILSKWGSVHEVVHKVSQCPYDPANARYYRITT